ncbi:hypothetical protein R3P38DRAFT_3250240 [Favolaschia claudopus]|uniref:Uncharacterized protein n=1 Tax=Favolaschia claudopus TaxID=2862362 RepID=A0AAW0EH03_9AGAR
MFFLYISFLVLGWLAYLGAADLAKTGYHEFTTTAPTLVFYASALAREFAIIIPILLVFAIEIVVAGYVLWHVLINNGYIDSAKSRFSNIEGPFPQVSASECSIVVLAGSSLLLRAVASPLDEDIDLIQFVPGAYLNDLESTDATTSTTASLVLMSVSRTEFQQGMLSPYLASLLERISATYHLWIISTQQSSGMLLDAFEMLPDNRRLIIYLPSSLRRAPEPTQYENDTAENQYKGETPMEQLSFTNTSISRAITWIETTMDYASAALDITATSKDEGEDSTLVENIESAVPPPTPPPTSAAIDEPLITSAAFDERVQCELPIAAPLLTRSATSPAPPTITSQLDLALQNDVPVDEKLNHGIPSVRGIALTNSEDSQSIDLPATRFAPGMSASTSTPALKSIAPPASSKSTLKGSVSTYMSKFRSATARIAPPFKKSFSVSVSVSSRNPSSAISIPPSASASDAPTLADIATKKSVKKSSFFRRPPLPFRSRSRSIGAAARPIIAPPPV